MAEAKSRRRGFGEDAIHFVAARNRYVGAVSLGYTADGKRLRRTVLGRTKQEVRDKLKALPAELDAGVRSSPGYTVRRPVEDWLREGLDRAGTAGGEPDDAEIQRDLDQGGSPCPCQVIRGVACPVACCASNQVAGRAAWPAT
jgi:hypothetical protein